MWRQYRAVQQVEKMGGEVRYENPPNDWVSTRFPALTCRVTRIDFAIGFFFGESSSMANVDDEAIARIVAEFPQLTELDLGCTAVTDDVIDALLDCPNLKSIGLRDTAVTKAGVRRLRDRFPDCEIYTEYDYVIKVEDFGSGNSYNQSYYLDLIAD